VLAVASLALSAAAQAQSLWQGATPTYETNTNWLPPTTPPSPPIGPGQLAVFDTGPASTTINVTGSSIAPDSWTFNAGAQSYTISGGAVNFSLAGPLGGIIDNANVGQTISIANNIGESVAGVQVQLLGASTLILSGTNSYTGGTTICSCATLQLGDATHTASIVGNVTNFGAFNIVNANTGGITAITNDLEGFALFAGLTTFLNATSAGTMTITNRNGGETDFGLLGGTDTASAGNAVIVNRLGG